MLIDGIVASGRVRSGWPLLAGFFLALLAVVLHYLSARCASAGLDLMRKNPLPIGSAAVLDGVAVLSFTGSIAALVLTVEYASTSRGIEGPFWTFIAFLACLHGTFVAANERLVGMQRTDPRASAGEIALSFFSFLYRFLLVLGPLLLGFGCTIGTLLFGWYLLRSWIDPTAFVSHINGETMRVTVLVLAWAPFLLYLAYLLGMALIDVFLAVLRIARNSDATAPGRGPASRAAEGS
jgi:hypothetical protein